MKTNLVIFMLLILSISLAAQGRTQSDDDLLFGGSGTNQTLQTTGSFEDDLIRVNYERKDARLAMLFSMLLPGAGQFYVDRTAIRTYIYPAIELALIGGILYFNNQGNKKTDDYEYYANGEIIEAVLGDYHYQGTRYNRNYQTTVQNHLIGLVTDDIYDGTFFRLDTTNSQHFYEDIGKYDKYVFGWADWYHEFAALPGDNAFALGTDPYTGGFVMSSSDFTARWLANHTIQNMTNGNFDDQVPYNSLSSSAMRRKYIDMRKDAEAEYSKARTVTFGLVANHFISAIDAVVMTNSRNRLYLSQSPFKFNYYTALREDRITPTLNLNYSF